MDQNLSETNTSPIGNTPPAERHTHPAHPPTPPAPQPFEQPVSELVRPLETYQSDMERYLREQNALTNTATPQKPSTPEIQEVRMPPIVKTVQPPIASPLGTPPLPPAGLDPRSLIFSTQEVHDPLNAARTNAGVLVANEATAILTKAPPPPPLPSSIHPDKTTQTLETYKGDVEQYVQTHNVSAVTVTVAEERRRRQEAQTLEVTSSIQKQRSTTWQIVAIVTGITLILGSVGGVLFAYLQSRPLPQAQTPVAPFIAVDTITDIQFKPEDNRNSIMRVLQTTKNQTNLSVGLVAQLRLWLTATTSTTQLQTQTLLSVLTPHIPPQLLRTIQPQFLLGIHSFNINQPFLIFSVDSYQGGFAGMLDWEQTMQQDLSPLFDY